MRKLLLATAAIATISTPAFAADSDTKDFDINARVTDECSLENPTNVNFGSLAINRAPGQEALLLSEFPASEIQNIWMSCNFDAAITIAPADSSSRGLTTDSPVTDTAQFTNVIGYAVRLEPTNANAFSNFLFKPRINRSVTRQQVSEFHDNAQLSIEIESEGVNNTQRRPVAGTYTDTIVITLAPSV